MTGLVVIAEVAGERIAFDAAAIEGVIDIGSVVPVPFADRRIAGLAAVRSQVLTVIDTAAAIGAAEPTASTRAVLVMLDGHRYALIVDTVEDVMPIEASSELLTAAMTPEWARVGVARVVVKGRFALLVDPFRLLEQPVVEAA